MLQLKNSNEDFHHYSRSILNFDLNVDEGENIRLAAITFLLIGGAFFFLSGMWGGPSVLPGAFAAGKTLFLDWSGQ